MLQWTWECGYLFETLIPTQNDFYTKEKRTTFTHSTLFSGPLQESTRADVEEKSNWEQDKRRPWTKAWTKLWTWLLLPLDELYTGGSMVDNENRWLWHTPPNSLSSFGSSGLLATQILNSPIQSVHENRKLILNSESPFLLTKGIKRLYFLSTCYTPSMS